ncbi:MAG: DUF349 domain-containing protein [Flavobacteriales bacterium]|nr:DUF349 domain-containing protein [Flavobacteriales bacterium]
MKSQLLEKFEQLLLTDDIMSIREAVRDLQADWKSETAKEMQVQRQEFESKEQEEGAHFEYVPSQEDEKFSELLAGYKHRIDERGKELAAERLKNLEFRIQLLDDFEKVVKEEQNVGKAFAASKNLREQWGKAGDVPGDKYHELNDRYHKLSQEFYYNINIYKELQEHDLKINQRKKEELIERAAEIGNLKSVNEIELLVKTYEREWMEIGPSPRETYKETGDRFFGLLREAKAKINAHYEVLRSHAEENLNRKRQLVDALKNVLSMEFTNTSSWNKYTEEVLKLQEDWKHTGFAPKKENEEIWSEFRGLCDLFFQRKKSFFDVRRDAHKVSRDKKEALIAKAKELQESDNWKETTEALKKLQDEWKSVGSADPRDEQKLWNRFRSACDVFFERKKEHFSGVVTQQEENLVQKEALLAEIEAFNLSGDRNNDVSALREYTSRWSAIGFVPREKAKEINDRFGKLLDLHYGKLNVERSEKSMMEFRSRLENIKNSSDGNFKIRKERQTLRDKIDRLIAEKRQYENNMMIFTGAGAEALRKDIEKKIKATEREIEDLRKKMQLTEA